MKPLKLNPEALPSGETMVLVPQFRGANGSATFTLENSKSNFSIRTQARLGMFLFKNALNFEAVCSWTNINQEPILSEYTEINHKSGKTRSSLEGIEKAKAKYKGQQIMDPLSMLYALRIDPMKKTGESRVAFGARGENPISVELFAKEAREKPVKAFGNGNRKQLRLELLIESPKSTDKLKVFSDGKAALWIDQETNQVTEVGYEIQPFGRLAMVLDRVE
jgi:hypothetical protein